MKRLFILVVALLPLFVKSQTTDSSAQPMTGDPIFLHVEKEAHFPGGVAGWQKYLEHNLNAGLAGKYIP